jgi:hypothetical protein
VFEAARDATGGMPWLSGSIAWTYALAGRPAMARDLLRDAARQRSHSYVPPSAMAILNLALDEDDKVISWLRRGVEDHDPMVPLLGFMPCFGRLRLDAPFRELMRVVALPQ